MKKASLAKDEEGFSWCHLVSRAPMRNRLR